MSEFLNKLSDKLTKKQPEAGSIRYAGFNIRLLATIIDMVALLILIAPFALLLPKPQTIQHPPEIYEAVYAFQHQEISQQEFMVKVMPYFKQVVIPKIATYSTINLVIFSALMIIVWKYFNSSPGKMLLKLRIVTVSDFGVPTTLQYILRLIGYIIASIPFGLGFFLVGLSRKKQGLHDMIAGTTVIYTTPFDPIAEGKKLKYQAIFLLVAIVVIVIIYSMKNR